MWRSAWTLSCTWWRPWVSLDTSWLCRISSIPHATSWAWWWALDVVRLPVPWWLTAWVSPRLILSNTTCCLSVSLNPDRISLPDIDTDFDDDGRGKVLNGWKINTDTRIVRTSSLLMVPWRPRTPSGCGARGELHSKYQTNSVSWFRQTARWTEDESCRYHQRGIPELREAGASRRHQTAQHHDLRQDAGRHRPRYGYSCLWLHHLSWPYQWLGARVSGWRQERPRTQVALYAVWWPVDWVYGTYQDGLPRSEDPFHPERGCRKHQNHWCRTPISTPSPSMTLKPINSIAKAEPSAFQFESAGMQKYLRELHPRCSKTW